MTVSVGQRLKHRCACCGSDQMRIARLHPSARLIRVVGRCLVCGEEIVLGAIGPPTHGPTREECLQAHLLAFEELFPRADEPPLRRFFTY